MTVSAHVRGVVRYITAYQEGDQEPTGIMVTRIEGERQCRQCRRSHPYQLGLMTSGEVPVDLQLYDSWEDAAHQAREWLAEAPMFIGCREPEREAERSSTFFDNRAAAIEWLLEALQQ